MAICVLAFEPSRHGELRRFFEKRDFAFEDRPHAHFLARGKDAVTATAYHSGKLLLTGKDAEAFGRLVEGESLAKTAAATPKAAPRRPLHPHLDTFPRAGVDESGKGDFFGPLVAAAVHVSDRAAESTLQKLGVRDSKRLTDSTVNELAREIEARFPVARVIVNPARYNELYGELGNLNDLLAWCHVRALEGLSARTGARPLGVIVIDRFETKGRVSSRLNTRFPASEVVEVPRAEADPVVAAASIIARATFLTQLDALGDRYRCPLPKGAGPLVHRAKNAFIEIHGRDALGEVAKLHFRTSHG